MQRLYTIYLQHPDVCTDTRQLRPGCIFFTLRGANFNGNAYALQAIQGGAAYVVADDDTLPAHEQIIQVPDALEALQQLAMHHRRQLDIPVIGLTGTNGKTTTKELLNAVISTQFRTYATRGNLNNHIGVPLTVLAIPADTEVVIIEMGANHRHEIEFLCSIAQPTYGLITNVGLAHLEGFGSFEGVKLAKGELYDYMAAQGGKVFINAGNNHLMQMAVKAGLKNLAYYAINTDYKGDLPLCVSGSVQGGGSHLQVSWHADGLPEQLAKVNLTGAYNLENILAAIAAGLQLEISAELIKKGLEGYSPANNRSQIIKTENNTVIADFYNANPTSMLAAIENLAQMQAGDKMAILGDMYELGDEAPAQHAKIARAAMEAGPTIFIGQQFYKLKPETENAAAVFFNNNGAATEYLQVQPLKGCTVLLKGSRSSKLEDLLQYL